MLNVYSCEQLICNITNRFTDTGVTVNAVYPGISTTDISRHLTFYNSFTRFFIKPLAWLFLKSAAKGSQTLVHAAIDPELENVTGKFIRYFLLFKLISQNTFFFYLKLL